MTRRSIRGFWAAVAALLALAASAQAATLTVAGTADQAQGTGSCNGSNVCTSLRAAVENASAGSTISLGAHQYTLSTGPLTVARSETIAGAGTATTVIRQTKDGAGVIVADTGDLTLSNLTLTGGRRKPASGDQDRAGGIYDDGSSLTLNRVAVSGNTSTGFSALTNVSGGVAVGGIEIGSSTTALTLANSVVNANSATGGHGGDGINGASGGTTYGAIYDGGSTLNMSSTTILGNSATGGTGGSASGSGHTGGIAGQPQGGLTINLHGAGTGTITASTITGNQTIGGSGGAATTGARGGAGNSSWGAIEFFNGTLAIRRTLIAANRNRAGNGGNSAGGQGGDSGSATGGGVVFSGGAASIVNSTIANNTVTDGTPGTGTPAGSSDSGRGGGLDIQSPASVELAGDTFVGNQAGQGGNIEFAGPTTLIQDTIVAGGVSLFGSNCDVEGSPTTDTGNNLESTTPSQCGFSTGHKDLVGANPQLAALAANGGPTQTEALGPSSPARAAGGACIDPTQPGITPLGVDQRGLPRPVPCDIGAFESQAPRNVGAPTITGKYKFAGVLTCNPGTWAGDNVNSLRYAWTRGGKAIGGATHQNYTIAAKDFGTSLSCIVTAIGTYGQASATATITAPQHCNCIPRLSKVSQSRRVWRRKAGTVFKFKLDRAAKVTLKFTGKHGHNGGKLTLTGHRGRNKISFVGRISRHNRLSPGSYTVAISAALPGAPSSRPVKLSFTII